MQERSSPDATTHACTGELAALEAARDARSPEEDRGTMGAVTEATAASILDCAK
jgi:hypothetical protein